MIGLRRPWVDDSTLMRWLQEDLGMLDLTSILIFDRDLVCRSAIITREECIVACVEEAARIYELAGASKVDINAYTGQRVNKNFTILEAYGDPYSLHIAWRLAQNILSIFSGVATKTYRLIEKVRKINRKIILETTRKTPPGLRSLYLKAVIAGGAVPHRLGLHDTILIFENHIKIIGGWQKLEEIINKIRSKTITRPITVEAKTLEQAIIAAKSGANIIQLDKMKPEEVEKTIQTIRRIRPDIIIIVTGNIDEENIEEYAKPGPDIIVTSAPYYARPIDITTKIEPTNNNKI